MTMTAEQLRAIEKKNTSTSWTRSPEFDRDGYLVIKDLAPSLELQRPVPHHRGQINYWGRKPDQFTYCPEERQVQGSLSTYKHPQYRDHHIAVRQRLESAIGRKLYTTYYFDRFYWASQELDRHTDRDACEISVTVHIGTSLEEPWPVWIQTPSGEERSVILQPGDGMIYKGCERPHWRNAMPGNQQPGLEDWYHQVFFHYVLQDGIRAHHAGDVGGHGA